MVKAHLFSRKNTFFGLTALKNFRDAIRGRMAVLPYPYRVAGQHQIVNRKEKRVMVQFRGIGRTIGQNAD